MIICEISLNHMGSEKYATHYIDKIIKAKAVGVLFHIREKEFYLKNPRFFCKMTFISKLQKNLKELK